MSNRGLIYYHRERAVMKIDMNKIVCYDIISKKDKTVSDFINEIQPVLDNEVRKGRVQNHFDLKKWLINNQIGHNKHVPEIYEYFRRRYAL